MREKGKIMRKKPVNISKNIRGGIPCVTGTRIPVENIVYLNKKKRISPNVIALKYYTQVSIDQVKDVLRWFENNKNKYGMVI